MARQAPNFNENRYPTRQNYLPLFVWEPGMKRRSSKNILDLLTPKFTLHVIDQLAEEELHFNELARRIQISTNTLRDRLRMLTREGVIARKVHSRMPPSVSYRLTDKGKALSQIIKMIWQWEQDWIGRHPDLNRAVVQMIAAEGRKAYGKEGKVS